MEKDYHNIVHWQADTPASCFLRGHTFMIRNAIQRFMYGRYGNDQLNVFLIGTYLVLYLLFLLTRFEILYWVCCVPVIRSIGISNVPTVDSSSGSPEARGRSQSPAGDAEPVSRKKADIKPWNLRDTPGKGTRIFHQSVFKKGHLP